MGKATPSPIMLRTMHSVPLSLPSIVPKLFNGCNLPTVTFYRHLAHGFFPTLGAMQFNKSQTERAKDDIKKAMKVLNDHLLHHTYLVGERISLADIAVACTMLHLCHHVMAPSFRNA